MRSGEWPKIVQTPNLDAQISRCMTIIEDLLTGPSRLGARDIMILCKRNALRERIAAELDKRGIAASVSTIHGARGLQAKAVILVGADDLQGPEDRALMYVALTRPTDHLSILWSHDTPFVKELARNLDTARAP